MNREVVLEKFQEAFEALAFYQYQTGFAGYSARKELLIEILRAERDRDSLISDVISDMNDDEDEYSPSNWE